MTRIAVAIVVGCIAIAVALYLGLRARDAPPPQLPPPPVAPDRDTIRALTMQAAAQLEGQRARIDAACWPQTGSADPARYDVELAIAADGHELGRSVLELRNQPSRADVAACIRRLALPPMAIARPGQPVTLTIPLVLP